MLKKFLEEAKKIHFKEEELPLDEITRRYLPMENFGIKIETETIEDDTTSFNRIIIESSSGVKKFTYASSKKNLITGILCSVLFMEYLKKSKTPELIIEYEKRVTKEDVESYDMYDMSDDDYSSFAQTCFLSSVINEALELLPL